MIVNILKNGRIASLVLELNFKMQCINTKISSKFPLQLFKSLPCNDPFSDFLNVLTRRSEKKNLNTYSLCKYKCIRK